MVSIEFTSQFKKSIKHLSELDKIKLEKLIKKIILNPDVGKPLKYLRGERTIRLVPYRLIYSYRRDLDILYLLKLEHRDSVYD
jgi:mRNA-degrading endonuclease RelE of RelBE toxin-antitoxin system